MVRDTSLEAYNEIRNNGLLSKMRFTIYKAVVFFEGSTANEIFERLGLKTNQSGRFTELREMGVIKELSKRECNITGRKCITWGSTDKLPQDNEL